MQNLDADKVINQQQNKTIKYLSFYKMKAIKKSNLSNVMIKKSPRISLNISCKSLSMLPPIDKTDNVLGELVSARTRTVYQSQKEIYLFGLEITEESKVHMMEQIDNFELE